MKDIIFKSAPTSGKTFNILSRNNDTNGNPFRMAIVYDAKGNFILAIEERSSCLRHILRDAGLIELEEFHLTPKQYNEWKRHAKKQFIFEIC